MSASTILDEKLTTLENVQTRIAPEGSFSMFYSFCFGQPIATLEAIGKSTRAWKKVEFITGMTLAPYAILKHPMTSLLSGYYSPVERELAKNGGNVDYHPREFHGFFQPHVEDLKIDWIATTTTMMDSNGNFNLGVTGDLTEWFIRHKINGNWRPKVLVEMNEHMPRILGFPELGNHEVNVSDVDMVVTGAEQRPIPQHPKVSPDADDLQIAGHVHDLVDDGSTIQIGIGRLPDAIGDALDDKHDLGFHTEMLTSCVKRLVERGAVTGRQKCIKHPLYTIYNDKVIFTFAGGTRDLYDFVDNNKDTRCVPLNHLNDTSIIRLHEKFVSINAILGCDLRGQTISSAYHDGGKIVQYSGIGGQATFVRAAQETRGGKSFQCMPSTRVVNGRRVSNIVAYFPAGAVIGTPEYFADYIVTEFGAAKLRHLGVKDRARALINIAHPDFQDEITRDARQFGIL
ncbi:MAG: hypothetical protein GYA24_14920 [Candidatus Lokiarchaeota archaeon]|nr:hypothetical protein [Candidatus Lokiarchaeota archaeon]